MLAWAIGIICWLRLSLEISDARHGGVYCGRECGIQLARSYIWEEASFVPH
jgi:hypothetical protein